MKNLIEYLGDIINSINIISLKQKGEIILSEDDKSAKLKELKIKYNVDDYDIFLMTLDVNNFIIKNKNEGIYSCFQIHTCSSMDYILFAKNKRDSKYHIYHLELKSKTVHSEDILKKHVTSLETLKFILSMIYFKSIKDNVKIEDFPEKFYHKVVVFNMKKSGHPQNKMKLEGYNNINAYKGKFKNEYKYFTYGVTCNSNGYSIDKIYLRNLFEDGKNFFTEKLEIKKMIYN